MKPGKAATLSFLVAGVLASAMAEAGPGGRGFHHGGRHHGGGRVFFYAAPVIVGAYLASRYYYPPPYYPPAPVYYAPPPPPVYIEQPQVAPQSQAYWYYCPQSRAYYPHVQSCAGPWQRVAPQPPPG